MERPVKFWLRELPHPGLLLPLSDRDIVGALLVVYTRAYSFLLDFHSGEHFLTFGATFFLWRDLFSLVRLFVVWRDFFLLARLFFRWRDSFFLLARLFLLERLFFAGATFFCWRDLFLWLNFLAWYLLFHCVIHERD